MYNKNISSEIKKELLINLRFLISYNCLFQNVSLTSGSKIYDEWVEPDQPKFMKYHMFTYTNAQEFIGGLDAKPQVEEVGVLSYRLEIKETNEKNLKNTLAKN